MEETIDALLSRLYGLRKPEGFDQMDALMRVLSEHSDPVLWNIQSVVEAAIDAACACEDPAYQVMMLELIAGQKGARRKACQQALTRICQIEDERERSDAIRTVAYRLADEPDLWQAAMLITRQIVDGLAQHKAKVILLDARRSARRRITLVPPAQPLRPFAPGSLRWLYALEAIAGVILIDIQRRQDLLRVRWWQEAPTLERPADGEEVELAIHAVSEETREVEEVLQLLEERAAPSGLEEFYQAYLAIFDDLVECIAALSRTRYLGNDGFLVVMQRRMRSVEERLTMVRGFLRAAISATS